MAQCVVGVQVDFEFDEDEVSDATGKQREADIRTLIDALPNRPVIHEIDHHWWSGFSLSAKDVAELDAQDPV